MGLNKIQLKAEIFRLIEPIKSLSAVDDNIVNDILCGLRKIEDADFEFISKLLIKEADYKNQKASAVFLYMAENLSPESFMGLVTNELNSNRVADEQKIFLINVLSGLGVKFEIEDMSAYLSNPDEAINTETKRFLESAKVDPEAQIDFLDFYYSSSDEDRSGLITSVVEDFDGDRLANIISPLLLNIHNEETTFECIDILEKTRSLLSVKFLKYMTFSPNEKISRCSMKLLRKMALSGFYTEEKLHDFYKNLLEDFEEPLVRISLPDGNSNFSIVVSRKTKQGAYFVSFTALNIELGPFSAFGFSSITKSDYDTVVRRFFSGSRQIIIPASYAKKILKSLTIKRIILNKEVPYEYLCWERLLDDAEELDFDLDEILLSNLKKVQMDETAKKIILTSPFIENWFYRYSKNHPAYSAMIDKILSMEPSKMEGLVEIYSTNAKIINNMTSRIKFLAFCLKMSNCNDFANAYYSLLFDKKMFKFFISCILKRSIYEYMLDACMPDRNNANIFKRTIKVKDVSSYINYIEENWVENNGA